MRTEHHNVQENEKVGHSNVQIGNFELNKIYCMDCLEGLRQLPDNCIDLVLTDPPYGINADINQQKAGGKNGWRKYDKETDWDNKIPEKEIFNEIFRVSKNQIIWGGNYFTDYLKPSMCWLIWDKGQRDFSLADGEMAWTSFNKAMRIFTYSRAKFLNGINEKREHPTQKPVALGQWILEKFANKDSIILDPFAGSGSFLLASKHKGMKFIGFEIDKDYCEIANKRLNQETLF
jgi:site-specific DNA-methyltransferase (adenine-specific)